MEDFYNLRGYSNYQITKSGIVKNIVTNEILEGTLSGSGYWTYRLTDDKGKALSWGVHRLLAWVFLVDCEDITGLVINHLDGDKLNNDLSNLEITTYQGNLEHAGRLGLTSKCIPVQLRNVKTGVVTKYPSMRKAALALKISADVVGNRCIAGEDIIFSDFNQYKIGDEDFKPLDVEDIENQINYGRKQRIYKRCLKTNEITVFDSCRELAKDLGVSEASISIWARLKTQPVLKGLVQIQLAKDLTDWIDHDCPIKVYESFNKVKVVMVDKGNGIPICYLSAVEAAKALNIKTTTLDYRLKQPPKHVFKDGTSCWYYSNRSPLAEMHLG